MSEKEAIERALFSDTSRYNDIMDKPRHVSRAHLLIPQSDRAAQFAPFAALTGYHKLLAEVANRYSRKRYPTLQEKKLLNAQLAKLAKQLPLQVKMEYFNGKSGYYQVYEGQLETIDMRRQRLNLIDLTVPIANIRKISVQE